MIGCREETNLLFAEKRKVEQNLKGLGVCGEDNKLRDAAVKRLGR
jgi:hypothetical protein